MEQSGNGYDGRRSMFMGRRRNSQFRTMVSSRNDSSTPPVEGDKTTTIRTSVSQHTPEGEIAKGPAHASRSTIWSEMDVRFVGKRS